MIRQEIDLAMVGRVFMLGIGGIGMSGLARYFKHRGMLVSGYDRTPTDLTDALIAEGIPVTFDLSALPPVGTDLLVVTPAVKEHPAYTWAVQTGVPVRKRAEVLGDISRKHRTLAVAGTHGKTTTTALLAYLLQATGQSPTAFVGGIMENYGTNFLTGGEQWLAVEADEFDRSFLQLSPEMAALTSASADHLDIYGTAGEVTESYLQFLQLLPPTGVVLLHENLPTGFGESIRARVYRYGLGAGVDNRAENIRQEGLASRFDYVGVYGQMKDVLLPMPGLYNLSNAVAAITLALAAGAEPEVLKTALEAFQGIRRRYQVRLQTDKLVLVDDYAHHPEEIEAAVQATRDYLPGWQVWVVFQPHLFSRTRDFADGFAVALSLADEVYLAEIYPAREQPIPGITADVIFQQIRTQGAYRVTLDEVSRVIPDRLSINLKAPTVVLVLGAGDIDTVVTPLADALRSLA